MNELLDEAEAAEALQHVLAFLDAYGDSAMQIPIGEETEKVSTKQHKHTQRLAAKTRYRDRIKGEHSRLRSDVRALQAKLEQLQGTISNPQAMDESGQLPLRDNSAPHETRSTAARATVVREYKLRKQAEAVNLELKALLSKVQKACNSTAVTWERIITTKNLALLHEPVPLCDAAQHHQHHGYYDWVASLSRCIDRLDLDTDLHFHRAGLSDSNSFTYRTQRVADSLAGSAFDITMTSLLPCPKEHAKALILRSLADTDKHVSRQTIKSSALEIINTTVKSVRFGHQQYKMEGIGMRRSVLDADRYRLLWSTLAFLPEAVSKVQEECVMALQTTSVSPPECLLQIWYRVSTEPFISSNSNFHPDSESERLKESVLRSHCRTTGDFFQSLERMLANEVYNPYPNSSG